MSTKQSDSMPVKKYRRTNAKHSYYRPSLGRATLRLGKWTLRSLARMFPAKPPASLQRLFNETLDAAGLDPTEYKLVYIPHKAIKRSFAAGRSKYTLFLQMMGVDNYTQIGQAAGKTAFVVESTAGRAAERKIVIHEAMHFAFGPHPWNIEL